MCLKECLLLVVLLLLCNEVNASELLTYNTFLVASEQGYEKRAAYIANNIGSTNADILCLQEVWDESDVRAIVSANKEKYPFTFSGIHGDTQTLLSESPRTRPRCLELQAFRMLLRALVSGCLTSDGGTFTKLQCLVDKAGYYDMSRSCISCLSMSGFDFGTLLKNCFIKKSESNLSGLLVMSRRKLRDPKLTYFDPEKTIFNRAYISFEDESVGDIRCTHQTAPSVDSSDTPYIEKNLLAKYGSWEKQHFDETIKLTSSLSDTGRRAIIMGDLNTGPFIPQQGNKGYFTDAYQYYQDNGFQPTLDSVCTYCLGNPLTDDDVSTLIDHILVRPLVNENKMYTAQRVFLNPIPGETYPPSDHYGVQLHVE